MQGFQKSSCAERAGRERGDVASVPVVASRRQGRPGGARASGPAVPFAGSPCPPSWTRPSRELLDRLMEQAVRVDQLVRTDSHSPSRASAATEQGS